MPYRVRYYPLGIVVPGHVARRGYGKFSASSTTGAFKSSASAKKSRVFKVLKGHGYSPRIEKFKRRK